MANNMRPELPSMLHVFGRDQSSNNSDCCGEYRLHGLHEGRAIYRRSGNEMSIYFHTVSCRWVIDRAGISGGDVCVAFADDPAGGSHPCRADLVWNVWDETTGRFERDDMFCVLDSPPVVSIFGRSHGQENVSLIGTYDLIGVHHGKPMYRQRDGPFVIRFEAHQGEANNFAAFADVVPGAEQHPGCLELVWNIFDARRNGFSADLQTRALPVPGCVHLIGSHEDGRLGDLFGSYILAGTHDGAGLFVRPGTTSAIRYSARFDRWLLDLEALAQPSLMSRLYQWAFSGGSADDRCVAYATGCGERHPGCITLDWHVFDQRAGRHVPAPGVRSTSAPLTISVYGRQLPAPNAAMCGEYVLAGTCMGHAAYSKAGSSMAVVYNATNNYWTISTRGLAFTDECVAYTRYALTAEHPVGAGPWNVYDAGRGTYSLDHNIGITEPPGVPQMFDKASQKAGLQDTAPSGGGGRWFGLLGG
eukprot:TRINITY_DN36282_c0_g2_i7.p1 TRINITY_DN36282_c0_g2~~TRINITY_DN36282_c0_g2_i7.p1  ORF type:complete len:474 (-),score=78.66 TRINITY_DN36282_c0_g2_i7:300-1721(-)